MPAIIYGAEVDAYTTGSQQLHKIGQRMMTPDGSVFRYAEKGAADGVANNLQQSAVPTAHWYTQALTVAITVGDITITVADGGTAFVIDQMAGGTIITDEVLDLGHIYRVKSNAVTASNETVCTLENGVTVQVTVPVETGNCTTALLNPWKDIIVSPQSAPTALAIGVPCVVIAASGYGWVQTRGPASVLIDSGTDVCEVGMNVRPSETHAAMVALCNETATVTELQTVGVCMETAPDDDFGHVFLTIE